mgnify:FL=1
MRKGFPNGRGQCIVMSLYPFPSTLASSLEREALVMPTAASMSNTSSSLAKKHRCDISDVAPMSVIRSISERRSMSVSYTWQRYSTHRCAVLIHINPNCHRHAFPAGKTVFHKESIIDKGAIGLVLVYSQTQKQWLNSSCKNRLLTQ